MENLYAARFVRPRLMKLTVKSRFTYRTRAVYNSSITSAATFLNKASNIII